MKRSKRILIGCAIILLTAMMVGAPVLAQNTSKPIDVQYRDIKIYVDGNIIIPKDAGGRIVEPFIYEGTTYLPARAISEALGKTVEWDSSSNSVYIGGSVPQEIVEITVSTAEELVSALGSNRRILLQEGVYNLTDVDPGYINNSSIQYAEIYDGPELHFNRVNNLTIQGVGEKQSEIIIEPRYAFVMSFENCSNINISNIKAGHTDDGYCSGGVFSFENSSGIRIDDTLMYGCGSIGLALMRVTDMEVINSSIYECTYGIMNIAYSSDILFKDCIFRDNTGFEMVNVGYTSGLTIDSCSFLRNTPYMDHPYPFFSISQSENLVVKNTAFIGNVAERLISQDDIEFDDSNTFEDNSFKTGTTGVYAISDDEFQVFLETWKLSGIIPDSIVMTPEHKASFVRYIMEFDDVTREYIVLLLQGISAGEITITADYDDYKNGVYLNYCESCLFDMNNDGFPELILRTGRDEAGYWYTVYTIVDGELIDCGGVSGSHAGLYSNGS